MTLKALLPLLCLFILPGTGFAAGKTVYGLNEYAQLAGIDLEVAAKLDTGAKTASLSARDIKRFKRDGESWVRFYLAIDTAHSHPIERPWHGSARSSAAPATMIPMRARTTPHAR